MKITMKSIRLFLISLLAISVGLSSMAFVPLSVPGDDPVPTTAPKNPNKGAQQGARLAANFKREQDVLARQQANLDKIKALAARAQTLIDKAKANGKDVTALESALAAFNSKLPGAQAQHDTAAGILSTHSGFDASGTVTDAAAARQTLQSARQSLQGARQTLRQAIVDLRTVLKSWRTANHKSKTTPESGSGGSGA